MKNDSSTSFPVMDKNTPARGMKSPMKISPAPGGGKVTKVSGGGMSKKMGDR